MYLMPAVKFSSPVGIRYKSGLQSKCRSVQLLQYRGALADHLRRKICPMHPVIARENQAVQLGVQAGHGRWLDVVNLVENTIRRWLDCWDQYESE